MGFFNALKNIALGKPVFEASPQKQQVAPVHETASQAHTGPKIIPQLYIERTNCHTSGDDMEVEVVIQNYSNEELLLDKIEMLGQSKYLNAKRVGPGEEDDLTAFDGDRPKNTYSTECLVYYKNEAGDYFCSNHNVEYQKMPDDTYMVRTIRFLHVRDV